MGHHTILRSGNTALPGQETDNASPELYLVAKYNVPICWLALFGVNDIKAFRDDREEAWPYLIAPRESALLRLRNRRDLMFNLLPKAHLTTFEMFCSLLDGLRQPYLHCDTSDVGSMHSDADEWRGMLREMLEALDHAPPSRMRTGLAGILFGSGLSRGWSRLLEVSGFGWPPSDPDNDYYLAGDFEEILRGGALH